MAIKESPKKTVTIVMASDVRGIIPNATTIASVLRNTDRDVHVRMFSRDFKDQKIRHDRLVLEIINTPDKFRLDGSLPNHIATGEAYDRITALAGYTDWERALILDYDQVVVGNIDFLFDVDFEESLFAGVNLNKSLKFASEKWFHEEVHPDYVNTSNYSVYAFGVLLNLTQFHKEDIFNIFQRCIKKTKTNDYIGLFMSCSNKALDLKHKFNVFTHLETHKIPKDIRILHFNGEQKPWNNYFIPFAEVWYQNHTSWKELTRNQWDPFDEMTRIGASKDKRISSLYSLWRFRFARIFGKYLMIRRFLYTFYKKIKNN